MEPVWPTHDLTHFCTVLYGPREMRKSAHIGAEDARNQLPELLEAAEKGNSTIISKYGRPVAALVPIEEYGSASLQRSLLPLRGSAKKLWGKDSVRTFHRLRDEWNR